MIIAGEASGDQLAAELVRVLREKLGRKQANCTADSQPLESSLEPQFFGAGGAAMKAAGVELAYDMSSHSVVGLSEVLKDYLKWRRIFRRLLHERVSRRRGSDRKLSPSRRATCRLPDHRKFPGQVFLRRAFLIYCGA